MVGIRQEDPYGDEDDVVIISPERVEQVIRFLRAVKDQILTDQADEAEARATELPPG